MAVVAMSYLLEAGVHFGHQTKRWNPKMKEYIFNTRDDIYIMDLQKTTEKLEEAYEALKKIVADGGKVLFVGTKKQAAQVCQEEAARTGMYYMTERWLGGTLTNFKTIRNRVYYLEKMPVTVSNCDGHFALEYFFTKRIFSILAVQLLLVKFNSMYLRAFSPRCTHFALSRLRDKIFSLRACAFSASANKPHSQSMANRSSIVSLSKQTRIGLPQAIMLHVLLGKAFPPVPALHATIEASPKLYTSLTLSYGCKGYICTLVKPFSRMDFSINSFVKASH